MLDSLETVASNRRRRGRIIVHREPVSARIVHEPTGEILGERQFPPDQLGGLLIFSYEVNGRWRSYIGNHMTWHSPTAVTIFVREDGLSMDDDEWERRRHGDGPDIIEGRWRRPEE